MPKKTKFEVGGKQFTQLPKAIEARRKLEAKTGQIETIVVHTVFGDDVVISGEEWKWDPHNYAHQIPAQYR